MLASLRETVPAELTHEIIFVDDGSADGTREWLRTLNGPPFKIILNESNLGYAVSNNRGAAEASGRLLCLLNNDLVLAPGWLDPMLRLYSARGDVGVVGNVQRSVSTGLIDHAGIFINAKGKPEHDRTAPEWLSKRREVLASTGACLLIAREVWQDVGGFDERYVNGCEDVDLCLRLRSRRRKNWVALDSVIDHHVSASPGRKRRDEVNTRKLTLRWRDELVYLGAKAWCRDYLARELNAATAFSSPAESAQIVAYAMGLTREPPGVALFAMERAINRELTRWREILGEE